MTFKPPKSQHHLQRTQGISSGLAIFSDTDLMATSCAGDVNSGQRESRKRFSLSSQSRSGGKRKMLLILLLATGPTVSFLWIPPLLPLHTCHHDNAIQGSSSSLSSRGSPADLLWISPFPELTFNPHVNPESGWRFHFTDEDTEAK